MDTDVIEEKIQEFIDAYNDALAYLKAKTAVDSTGVRQPLSHELIYRSLIGDLRTVVAGAFTTDNSAITMLSHLGISADSDGQLSIEDADDFEDALESDSAAVAALFKGTDNLADQIEALLDPFADTGGHIDSNEDNVDIKISNVDDAIERWEERLARKEALYIEQYSRLEQALSQLNSQRSFLTQIIAAMDFE